MARRRLRVLVVGCTPLAGKSIETIESLECCELVGVVNLPPEKGHLKSNYDSFPRWVERRPDDVLWSDDVNSAAAMDWMRAREPDVLLQAGWSQIFKPEVLGIAKLSLGLHPAPLPKGRGGAVINWRIIEGGGSWGNSLFVMLPSVDAGEVLDTEPFEIEPRDDARTAHLKVDRTAVRMIRRTFPKIAAGEAKGRAQDPSQVTKYRKRTPADGRIDPSFPAEKWLAYVRALTHPYPGAFLQRPEGPLVIWNAELGAPCAGAAPGELLEVKAGKGMRFAAGDGRSVWATLVTPPGDYECWADEWALEKGLVPAKR